MDQIINKAYVCADLEEAADSIKSLSEKVKSGELDGDGSIALAVHFQHIINHLCLAWHEKWLREEQMRDFIETKAPVWENAVPDWGFNLTIVDIEDEVYEP